MIVSREMQRSFASFVRAEAVRGTRRIPIDPARFLAAMASRRPLRPERPGAVDPVTASRVASRPFLLRD
jgi:hypothetical protein